MKRERRSWKEILDKRRRENFVGRAEYLCVFRDNFVGEEPDYLVFSVTGEGGVGKSTLLEQFANIASSHNINAIVVTSDDKYTSPASAMGHIKDELARLGISHKDFDERHEKYRELREEIENDPKAPRGAIDLLAHGITDLAIKSGRKVPGIGVFLEGADEKAAGETLAQLINYGITRWGNKDEVKLLREPEHVLTPLFVDLLAKACEKQRLVLIFDVFERTSQSLAPWLLALFKPEYGELDTNLTFVIAGRDPLEQHWTELAGSICHVTLEPFTPDETQRYLYKQGITDDRLVAQIHEDTGGLPVLVELLAATKPQPDTPLPDVSNQAVERFLLWIPQEDRCQVALFAAVPRYFNRDTLNAALGSDTTSTFSWLSTQSFIRRTAERGYGYHEKVRELMLRHLRNTTPKDLADTHSRLAAFFASEQMALKLEGRAAYESETWRRLECERVYHIISVHADRNIHEVVNAFLHAFRWRPGFANEIARLCRQIGQDTGLQSIKSLAGTLLEVYEAYDLGESQIEIENLRSLERLDGLALTARCKLHALLGYFCREEGKFDQALTDYNRAIELDEKYAWAVGGRGLAHCLMGKYEEALADFNRGIELDEKYIWAFGSRGETYLLMGKYEEALADLNRAIYLDDEDSWAIAKRGETYQSMGKYKEALADLNRAIGLNEKESWMLTERGVTYRSMGKYEEALADFDRAIEWDEEDALAIAERGVTHRLMGKYEEALADLNRAIYLDDEDPWAIAERGATYRRMGQIEKAIQDFTAVVNMGEADSYDFCQRAATYISIGNIDAAQSDFSKALELPLEDEWDYYGHCVAFVLSNEQAKAIEMLNEAFQRNIATRVCAESDDLLDPLRHLPEFQNLMEGFF